jgi:hypothetical protein
LEDPRSHIAYEDAKTYFSARGERYDIIVSEPSNPWVSGVASLFTAEFYADVRRYLSDGGLLVQWVQLYEITPALLGTVIAALDTNFADYEFWLANSGDMVIVASANGRVPAPDPKAFAIAPLRAEMARFGITNADELALHRVAGRAALAPYFITLGTNVNSDYYPVLEMNAPLARFMNSATRDLLLLTQAPFPVLRLFDERARRSPDPARLSAIDRPWSARADWIRQAEAIRRYLDSSDIPATLDGELVAELSVLRAALRACKVRIPEAALQRELADVARFAAAQLPRESALALWNDLVSPRCERTLSSTVREWLALHRAVAARDAAQMRRAADAVITEEPRMGGGLLAYAVAAGMTARILTGDGAAAIRVFQDHRAQLASAGREWQPVFHFLVAQAYGG